MANLSNYAELFQLLLLTLCIDRYTAVRNHGICDCVSYFVFRKWLVRDVSNHQM